MNYLAHFYLSCQSDEAIAGSWLGDDVKGRIPFDYPEAIRHAIQLHRHIDSFTDSHPLLRQQRNLFSPSLRRYHGIILDVFFDHCLAKHWHSFHGQALHEFSQEVYGSLQRSQQFFAPKLWQKTQYMMEHDWLGSYQQFEILQRAFTGISQRLRRENPLPQAYAELHQHYDALEQVFFNFVPDLQQYVTQHSKADHPLKN